MKKIIILFACVSILFGDTIHIAVAANMGTAIKALKSEFLKNRANDNITITLASSGVLSAQIQHDAPYAIFLSANVPFAQQLFEQGYALKKPDVYAQGILVMFSKTKQDFSKGLDLLKDASIKTVAIANPQTAPYGKAALESFQNAKMYEEIEHKLVYAGNISQAFSYALKVANIGFIAKSALFEKGMDTYKQNENYIEVDKTLYKPLKQGMIQLKKSNNSTLAHEFYQFLLSEQAKEILQNYGYLTDE